MILHRLVAFIVERFLISKMSALSQNFRLSVSGSRVLEQYGYLVR